MNKSYKKDLQDNLSDKGYHQTEPLAFNQNSAYGKLSKILCSE